MKYNFIKIDNLLFIACFLCVISQLPNLWGNSVISLGYNSLWILIFLIFFKKYNGSLKINKYILFLPIIFNIFVIVVQLLTGLNYLNSNFFKPVNMCLFISVIGYFLGKYYDNKIIIKIIKSIVSGTIILAISIFFNTFSGVDWQNTTGYLYTAKNSAAMIFLIVIIMGILYFDNFKKIVILPILIFLSILIIMLKSRATIICLIFILLYIIIFYVKNRQFKFLLLFLFILIALYVIYNPSTYDFFINKIMLNNRGSSNLTVITSGRDEHLEIFKSMFSNYFLIGTGGTYLESFPLAVLISYGIFGGTILIIYAFVPMYVVLKNMKHYKVNRKLQYLILSINIVMILNSFFEELPPFGPGVKCFTLWLFFGIYVGFVSKVKMRREINEKY